MVMHHSQLRWQSESPPILPDREWLHLARECGAPSTAGKPQCVQWAACHAHMDVCDRGFAYNNGRVNMVQHPQHRPHTCNLCVAATIAHIAGESPTVCDPRNARGTISGRGAMGPCCGPCTPPHTANTICTNTTSCTILICDIGLQLETLFERQICHS